MVQRHPISGQLTTRLTAHTDSEECTVLPSCRYLRTAVDYCSTRASESFRLQDIVDSTVVGHSTLLLPGIAWGLLSLKNL